MFRAFRGWLSSRRFKRALRRMALESAAKRELGATYTPKSGEKLPELTTRRGPR